MYKRQQLIAESTWIRVLDVVRLDDEADAGRPRRRGDRRLELVDVAQVALDAAAAADLGPSLEAYDLCGNQPVCRVHPTILH